MWWTHTYSCLSSSAISCHVLLIILPISHNGALGFAALTVSHTFLENLMYGIKGFSGALGGFGTPFELEFWKLKKYFDYFGNILGRSFKWKRSYTIIYTNQTYSYHPDYKKQNSLGQVHYIRFPNNFRA